MQLMTMTDTGLRWDEGPEPTLSAPGQAIVRPVALASCDLDLAVVQGRFPLPGPYPFGHEAVAEVVAVGDGVRTVGVGDLVVVPFQISCGACGPCRRGRTAICEAHPPLSSFGLGTLGGLAWGGLLADLALVPHADAMLVPVPPGIDPATIASASDNLPDAWRSVGPRLAEEPGAPVLVVGGAGGSRSIGLYAAGLAVALGSERVVYLDDSAERLGIAALLGADAVEGALPRGERFPITVDASGSATGLRTALAGTAWDGWCTSVAVYLDDVPLPLLAMYTRCCTFHTGRCHARPGIDAVLDLVAAGFDPSPVTTTAAAWDDAVDAFADATVKVVLTR